MTNEPGGEVQGIDALEGAGGEESVTNDDGAGLPGEALDELAAMAEADVGAQADELVTARREVEAQRRETRAVVDRYRDAVLAAEPELPPELVQGETLEELESSLNGARAAVAQTRDRLTADEGGGGFPVGAPAPGPDSDGPRDFFFRNGEGSGFVWSAEGHIVTNQHVVADADRVTVIFPDGLELIAEVLGTDADSDLAVLKIEVPSGGLVPIELGDSSDVKVGPLAIAIGNPFGQEFTTTTGIVSAVGRTIRGGNTQFSIPQVIQTDAAINPGNSGGPLLDRLGRVIGINTQIISRTGASTGIGFAVPINAAKQVIPELIEHGEFAYAWLGISGNTVRREILELMDLPSETRGALVIDLARSGPAETAGLAGASRTEETAIGLAPVGGDIIVGIDGSPIKSMDDLITYLIENTRPGDRIAVDVIREGGETATIEVVLGTRPGEVN